MKYEFLIETTIVDKDILSNSNFYTPDFTVEIGDIVYTVIFRKYLPTNTNNVFTNKDFKFKHVVKKGENIEQKSLLQIINLMLQMHC